MTELLALAERCEAATGPDRDLNIAMLPLVGLRFVDEGHPIGQVCYDSNHHAVPMPRYTASIDAALTLVPEGQTGAFDPYFQDEEGVVRFHGYSFKPDWSRWTPHGNWIAKAGRTERTCATPALAICAAALRARSANGE